MITIGSLFSGIGGIDLGLERTGGFRTIWFSENDAYCSEVLKKHWPNVPNLGDITKVKWDEVEKPDMLVGGFPCQDVSTAGKRAGIEKGRRSGLWSSFAKAISILRPRYVLVENVPGLLNWFLVEAGPAPPKRTVEGGRWRVDVEQRQALARVVGNLREIGYDAKWQPLSAADVGANHKRERLFIVAYPHRSRQLHPESEINPAETRVEAFRDPAAGVPPNPNSQRRDDSGDNRQGGQILPPQVGKASEAFPKRDGRLARSDEDAETGTADADAEQGDAIRQGQQDDEGCAPSDAQGVGCQQPGEARAGRERFKDGTLAPTADSRSVRMEGSRQFEIREFPEFAPFKDVRRIEDLQNRPDIPQPLLRHNRHGISVGMGVCGEETERNKKGMNPINGYATKEKGNGREDLPLVQDPSHEEGLQRKIGRLRGIPQEAILQPVLLRDGNSKRNSNSLRISETGEANEKERLRDVRCKREPPHPPQEPGLEGQPTCESFDAVRFMPPETSLEDWKKAMEKTVCLSCLWETCEEVGLVPKTLPALKEIWEAHNDEDAKWLWVQARSGRKITMDRIEMTKALGNAVVPACAEVIGRWILQMEGSA